MRNAQYKQDNDHKGQSLALEEDWTELDKEHRTPEDVENGLVSGGHIRSLRKIGKLIG